MVHESFVQGRKQNASGGTLSTDKKADVCDIFVNGLPALLRITATVTSLQERRQNVSGGIFSTGKNADTVCDISVDGLPVYGA